MSTIRKKRHQNQTLLRIIKLRRAGGVDLMIKLKMLLLVTGIISALVATAAIVYGVILLENKVTKENQVLQNNIEKEQTVSDEKEEVLNYFGKSDKFRAKAEEYIKIKSVEGLVKARDQLQKMNPPLPAEDYHQSVVQLYSDYIDVMSYLLNPPPPPEKEEAQGKYAEKEDELFGPDGKYAKKADEMFGPLPPEHPQAGNNEYWYNVGRFKRLNNRAEELNYMRTELKEKFTID